jgi:hypothetical protein
MPATTSSFFNLSEDLSFHTQNSSIETIYSINYHNFKKSGDFQAKKGDQNLTASLYCFCKELHILS